MEKHETPRSLGLGKLETLYITNKSEELFKSIGDYPYIYPDNTIMSTRDIVRMEVMRLQGLNKILAKQGAVHRLHLLRKDKYIKLSDRTYTSTKTKEHRFIFVLTEKGRKYLKENDHQLLSFYGAQLYTIGIVDSEEIEREFTVQV